MCIMYVKCLNTYSSQVIVTCQSYTPITWSYMRPITELQPLVSCNLGFGVGECDIYDSGYNYLHSTATATPGISYGRYVEIYLTEK